MTALSCPFEEARQALPHSVSLSFSPVDDILLKIASHGGAPRLTSPHPSPFQCGWVCKRVSVYMSEWVCVFDVPIYIIFSSSFVFVNDLLFSGFSLFLLWKCVRFCFYFCCCLFLFVVGTCILCLLSCLTRRSFIDVLSCVYRFTGVSEINYLTAQQKSRDTWACRHALCVRHVPLTHRCCSFKAKHKEHMKFPFCQKCFFVAGV